MQETTFPVEIIIHDDASNDGTAEIIREYEKKYPQLFRNILQEENQWSQGKSIMQPLVTAPRANLIALTHGDDYWISSNKLEKQHNALKVNPDAVLCLHQCFITNENKNDFKLRDKKIWRKLSLEEILQYNDFSNPGNVTPGHTSTAFFSKNALNNSIDIIDQSAALSGDIPLFILLLRFGNAIYLNEAMSVHVIHSRGVSCLESHSGIKFYNNRVAMYQAIKCELSSNHHKDINHLINNYKKIIATERANNVFSKLQKKFSSKIMRILKKIF
jgi:glycosyltransferase involved in cell wall biosynthesis